MALLVASLVGTIGLAKPAMSAHARILVLEDSPMARQWAVSMPGSRLYRSKDDPKNLGWSIAAEALSVSRVRVTASGIEVIRTWNFAAMVGEIGKEEGPTRTVHPVLYPVGTDRFAMAILTHESTGYAGGGASWSWATFYELRDLSAPNEVGEGRLALLYKAIPFGCGKGIRACFTEREYRRSKRCQETWGGILRLRYASADSAGAMAWTATWEESHVPGGVTKEQMKVERTVIDLANPPTTQCTEPM